MADIITHDSIPDAHGGYFDSGWSCNQWMLFDIALVKKWGREKATQIFNAEWDKQSAIDTQKMTCQYNPAWVSYWKPYGYEHTDPFAAVVTEGISSIGNVAEGVTAATSGLSKSVNVLGKVFPVVTVIIVSMLVIGIGILIFSLARNPTMLFPAGRALSMIK